LDLVRVTSRALYTDDFAPPMIYAPRHVVEHLVEWEAAPPGTARIAAYRVVQSVDDGPWSILTPTAQAERRFVTAEPTHTGRIGYRIVAVDRLGLESAPSAPRYVYWKEQNTLLPPSKSEVAAAPAPLALAAGPNPFNPSTTISLQLPRDTHVAVRILDVRGREVRTLVDSALPAGEHRFVWDGRDEHRARVASGVYFVRLQAGNELRQLKVVLAK
jgi:hypothetical protein